MTPARADIIGPKERERNAEEEGVRNDAVRRIRPLAPPTHARWAEGPTPNEPSAQGVNRTLPRLAPLQRPGDLLALLRTTKMSAEEFEFPTPGV